MAVTRPMQYSGGTVPVTWLSGGTVPVTWLMQWRHCACDKKHTIYCTLIYNCMWKDYALISAFSSL